MMAEHPVVACYRGPDSVGALQLATTLAHVLGQPLVLAAAYRYEPVALGASPLPSAADERRAAAAQEAVDRARELLGAATEVRQEVVAAQDVAEGLADLARDLDACVLVLGRDVTGHVVADVIAKATCPIAVSPFDVVVPDLQPVARVAVADDGSPPALLALIAAQRIAALSGGGPPQRLTMADGTDAGAELAAASEAYDLLACGSRGRGRLKAALLGSVSSHLVRAARSPVLVVGPDVRAAPDRPLGLSTATTNH
jgi:nucleotide-binding universal stress UspA family protein